MTKDVDDGNIMLVKTAPFGKWEIARVEENGRISQHIREYPLEELSETSEIFLDFAESKLKEFPEVGCTITVEERKMKIIILPLFSDEMERK